VTGCFRPEAAIRAKLSVDNTVKPILKIIDFDQITTSVTAILMFTRSLIDWQRFYSVLDHGP
jgi:hypothetical protein